MPEITFNITQKQQQKLRELKIPVERVTPVGVAGRLEAFVPDGDRIVRWTINGSASKVTCEYICIPETGWVNVEDDDQEYEKFLEATFPVRSSEEVERLRKLAASGHIGHRDTNDSTK